MFPTWLGPAADVKSLQGSSVISGAYLGSPRSGRTILGQMDLFVLKSIVPRTVFVRHASGAEWRFHFPEQRPYPDVFNPGQTPDEVVFHQQAREAAMVEARMQGWI